MRKAPLESKNYAVKQIYCSDKMRFLFFLSVFARAEYVDQNGIWLRRSNRYGPPQNDFLPGRGSAIPQ